MDAGLERDELHLAFRLQMRKNLTVHATCLTVYPISFIFEIQNDL